LYIFCFCVQFGSLWGRVQFASGTCSFFAFGFRLGWVLYGVGFNLFWVLAHFYFRVQFGSVLYRVRFGSGSCTFFPSGSGLVRFLAKPGFWFGSFVIAGFGFFPISN